MITAYMSFFLEWFIIMPSRNDNPAKNHNYDKILKFGGFYMPVLPVRAKFSTLEQTVSIPLSQISFGFWCLRG